MSLELGRDGELQAERFLADKGWEIMERNWRGCRAEIDLIGKDGDTLVFVEVKRRRSKSHGAAASAVGSPKQKKIIRASVSYMRKISHEGPVRFDVIAIDGNAVNHIPGAFRAEGYTR